MSFDLGQAGPAGFQISLTSGLDGQLQRDDNSGRSADYFEATLWGGGWWLVLEAIAWLRPFC
jgi:hypothetical protein